ncbi:hypothetical protein [Burkholderia metallica]|uniref:hypothetical protein n=1 Tax=Burkholderia metallica TaxID=488729 RepID=UPI001CF425F0|nr:hypothetical protein [Burkholderia metallica]MCA7999401.1 hypothetical protein [Burkholderia metallica]
MYDRADPHVKPHANRVAARVFGCLPMRFQVRRCRRSGLDEAAMKATFVARHPNAWRVTMPNYGHGPMQAMSALLRDDLRGFAAGRGRSSVEHARRPEKKVLAAAA